MQDNMKENISRFIDNDLNLDQIRDMQAEMDKDPLLKQQLARYQMLSQAIQSSEVVEVKADFSSRISQQLEQEPVFFRRRNTPQFNWQTAAMAVAASLAVVAIISPALFNQPSSPVPTPASPFIAQQQQPAPQPLVETAQLPPAGRLVRVQRVPVNQRYNTYLQAHSNRMYTIGSSQANTPVARVAGFREGK